jgi:saccharopine dehydrogenase (NAD+, L-lysine forming)
LCKRAGVSQILKWDLEETKKGGPFPEILDVDIFVNCIYLNGPMSPFLTRKMLDEHPQRALSVLVDVSADTSNPNNPVPVYKKSTTFAEPLEYVIQERTDNGDGVSSRRPFSVCSIDHLPSLVPLESSSEFSEQLVRHLMVCPQTSVWTRAQTLFVDKLKLALA